LIRAVLDAGLIRQLVLSHDVCYPFGPVHLRWGWLHVSIQPVASATPRDWTQR
jgi:hypothetical protein